MTYYIDTSSLVKVYHVEAGTLTVLGIYCGGDEIVISELGVNLKRYGNDSKTKATCTSSQGGDLCSLPRCA
jgi:hypothetical protein